MIEPHVERTQTFAIGGIVVGGVDPDLDPCGYLVMPLCSSCTCDTTTVSTTTAQHDGLTVLDHAPATQCRDCTGCAYCASLYTVWS